MLVIRLARGGRTKYPVYRIVAAESSRAATGKFVEVLGHYNPHTKDISLKKEEISRRLSHGAQPSNSVVKLLQREKVELPAWVKLKTKEAKPSEADAQEAADVAVEAPVATAEEPATEVGAPAEENADARVAEAATAADAEVADNQTPMGTTETTEITEAAADAAVEANEAGAEAADPAPTDNDAK
jgi:small subunit ribosomal protein S16